MSSSSKTGCKRGEENFGGSKRHTDYSGWQCVLDGASVAKRHARNLGNAARASASVGTGMSTVRSTGYMAV